MVMIQCFNYIIKHEHTQLEGIKDKFGSSKLKIQQSEKTIVDIVTIRDYVIHVHAYNINH
jgi:DNA polymerase III epsilon subunit-like protein